MPLLSDGRRRERVARREAPDLVPAAGVQRVERAIARADEEPPLRDDGPAVTQPESAVDMERPDLRAAGFAQRVQRAIAGGHVDQPVGGRGRTGHAVTRLDAPELMS